MRRKPLSRIVASATIATILAIAAAGPVRAGSDHSLVFSGSCPVDVVFPIPVDVERARALVPTRYSFTTGATGKAFMVVSLLSCEDTVVDGVADGHASYSDLLFSINTPPGGGVLLLDHTFDLYWSWFVSDDTRLHARLNDLGMSQAYDPHMSLTATPATGGGLLTLNGSVSSTLSSFRITGTVLDQSPQGIGYTADFFQDVGRRILEAHLQKTAERSRAAALTLTTPMDSPLGWVLGDQCRPDPDGSTCSVSGLGDVTYLTRFEHDITVHG
jgi:hypothetical protein